MWTPALRRRGWKTEGEEDVYHESKENDQKGGPSFNTPAAAAKVLQPCLTLCNPIEGSPPGSTIPGILQARTLELAAISFSNAWKWKVKVKSLSRVRLFSTPWTAAYQASPSMGFSRQELLEWVSVAFSQHIWGLAIPQTSRNYLHLSISESDFHLLGIATDEWLKLWSSPSRPGKYTYKCKRYRKQKHINGVPQTENIFWKQWDRDQRSLV